MNRVCRVRFLDGPAAGKSLTIKRTPKLLRVVALGGFGPDAVIDALDQLDDSPRDGEAIVAYRLSGEVGTLHVDYRDKSNRRRGDWWATADYRVIGEQPPEATLRDRDAWREWCLEAIAKEGGQS